jgi:FKBP-type peptidyl-prolyl cis-trans isomerase FklB
MRQIMFLTVLCFLCFGVFAQVKKPAPAKTPVKTAGTSVPMKNSTDSFSYAVGLSIANFYKAQGVKNINTQCVMQALKDAKSGKPLMSEVEVNSCIVGFMQTARSEKASGNKTAGDQFLAENKGKAGVVTLPSGLQYTILTAGTGPTPTLSDKVRCHYTGHFIDGTVFESSYTNNQPIDFSVGQVIRGWTEALQLMPTGSKWRLFIPSQLGYGDMENGRIPGGSTLVFEVELLEIVKE